jgi:chromosome segregation ATPase
MTFLVFLVAGCVVSQEDYNRVIATLDVSQSQVADLQAKYDEVNNKLIASKSQTAELQMQIKELTEKYEIVGETPTETAQNIIKHYHETHIYSLYDFFVCSDMALDVWDMLKAQGINAIIEVGNVDVLAKDITEANHAWALAEVSPGEYLALETTGGFAVWSENNPLYYRGWSFDNPKEYKRFVEIKYEYNIRIQLIVQLNDHFESARQKALDASSQLSKLNDDIKMLSILDPLLFSKLSEIMRKVEECGEYVGKYNQLNELMTEQQNELEKIISEMRGLTQ